MSQGCDMTKIKENLYIGGHEAAEMAIDLGFTIILTVDIVLPSSFESLVSLSVYPSQWHLNGFICRGVSTFTLLMKKTRIFYLIFPQLSTSYKVLLRNGQLVPDS